MADEKEGGQRSRHGSEQHQAQHGAGRGCPLLRPALCLLGRVLSTLFVERRRISDGMVDGMVDGMGGRDGLVGKSHHVIGNE